MSAAVAQAPLAGRSIAIAFEQVVFEVDVHRAVDPVNHEEQSGWFCVSCCVHGSRHPAALCDGCRMELTKPDIGRDDRRREILHGVLHHSPFEESACPCRRARPTTATPSAA